MIAMMRVVNKHNFATYRLAERVRTWRCIEMR